VESLLADPARRLAMGRAGRRIVEHERNWETESGKLAGLYQALTR